MKKPLNAIYLVTCCFSLSSCLTDSEQKARVVEPSFFLKEMCVVDSVEYLNFRNEDQSLKHPPLRLLPNQRVQVNTSRLYKYMPKECPSSLVSANVSGEAGIVCLDFLRPCGKFASNQQAD